MIEELTPRKGDKWKRVFLEWEKMRLLFVALAGMFTIAAAWLFDGEFFWKPRFWVTIIEGAIVANLAYFAGPFVECYLIFLGNCPGWFRLSAFVCGTLLTMALALLAIMSMSIEWLPTQE